MPYVLKHNGRYIAAAPRRGRHEGCATTEYRDCAAAFDSAESARQWIDEIRAAQRAIGMKPFELARGVAVKL